MISVLPGKSFEFKNPNSGHDVDEIIIDVARLIKGVSPFVESIEFLNKTKSCMIDIVFSARKMHVIFKNPRDEEFDLNELENPVTPIQITGC